MVIESISVAALSKLTTASRDATVIDVRTPAEYMEVRSVVVSANIPLDQMSDETMASNGWGDKNQAYYLICRSGARSMKACEILSELGYKKLFNVTGGTNAWAQADLPVKSGS